MPFVRLGLFVVISYLTISIGLCEDKPCIPREVPIEGRSILCVCNATYCDTITREPPAVGTYVAYTSTHDGKRFEKSYGTIESRLADGEDDENEEDSIEGDSIWNLNRAVFRLFPNARYQTIEGFGGSVTDAAAINWRSLSDEAQMQMINTYYSKEGIEYNLMRIPISGCDFSTHPYTYNEYPKYDAALSNYSMTEEDLFLKLPMIKRAMRAATDEIKITATAWTSPIWMKTREVITGFAQLKPEYYQAYANYYLKFLEEYEKAEVKIWAITTTNEPLNGIIPLVDFNSLGWWPSDLARWVANNLGPTIRNSRFNDTLIIGIDDQRYMLPIYIAGMESAEPKAFDYLDGFAVHYYGNFVPASILSGIHDKYPDKIILATEACEGPMPWDAAKLEIGSWERGQKYAKSIFQDLNNYVVGWIDWNLCLDPIGGPNWVSNFVDAPIIVLAESDEFVKQPMFYTMGHFSKFIPRGSRRIRAARRSLANIEQLAVITPEGNIVVVLQNTRTTEMQIELRVSLTRVVKVTMEPLSLKTLEIKL